MDIGKETTYWGVGTYLAYIKVYISMWEQESLAFRVVVFWKKQFIYWLLDTL